ncbi:MAG: hypothetical protein ACRDO4_00915, partial [Nocardioides sp.]
MRRTVAAAALALAVAASGTATSPAYAEDDLEIRSPATAAPEQAAPAPAQVLSQAEAALDGEVAGIRRPEATLALRDLFATLPRLSATGRAEARRILARPTNSSGPRGEIKYRTRSVKRCGPQVCVHRVTRTRHAASKAWARKSLRVMGSVWGKEVGQMGYRRPVRDGRRGG